MAIRRDVNIDKLCESVTLIMPFQPECHLGSGEDTCL